MGHGWRGGPHAAAQAEPQVGATCTHLSGKHPRGSLAHPPRSRRLGAEQSRRQALPLPQAGALGQMGGEHGPVQPTGSPPNRAPPRAPVPALRPGPRPGPLEPCWLPLSASSGHPRMALSRPGVMVPVGRQTPALKCFPEPPRVTRVNATQLSFGLRTQDPPHMVSTASLHSPLLFLRKAGSGNKA